MKLTILIISFGTYFFTLAIGDTISEFSDRLIELAGASGIPAPDEMRDLLNATEKISDWQLGGHIPGVGPWDQEYYRFRLVSDYFATMKKVESENLDTWASQAVLASKLQIEDVGLISNLLTNGNASLRWIGLKKCQELGQGVADQHASLIKKIATNDPFILIIGKTPPPPKDQNFDDYINVFEAPNRILAAKILKEEGPDYENVCKDGIANLVKVAEQHPERKEAIKEAISLLEPISEAITETQKSIKSGQWLETNR
jgi:hypothetical protein